MALPRLALADYVPLSQPLRGGSENVEYFPESAARQVAVDVVSEEQSP
jgi:hypothetical protein